MNHTGLVAPPFRRCIYGESAGLPAWNWLSDCNPSPAAEVAVAASGATIPSSSTADFILGSTAVVSEKPDEASSGLALATGLPHAGAAFVSRYAISCGADEKLLDSVSLQFRYRAAPTNASTNNTAAVIKVTVTNTDNRPIAPVGTASLGNFSTPGGFSSPVVIKATGLKASCGAGLGSNPRGRLAVQFAVTNNDRPVTIPLDDKAGGFGIEVGWAAAQGDKAEL